MIAIACLIAGGAVCVALLLNLYRLARGPGPVDRALALDTLVVNTIALIVLLGILYGTAMYFEVALLFAMVGFVTTVAFCKYLLRGNVIE
ncbi:K+/H+ antiporter subunit F [Zavarzinia sp. CC-PAN008]|uniref:K+/H+ antiporter subunit F n=1 Tax=Zavarzinia sp. CC-PAN008 TaxID=3243332 RepID=UPI003F74AAB4